MDQKTKLYIFCLATATFFGIGGVYTKTASAQSWEMVANLPMRAFVASEAENEEADLGRGKEKRTPAITMTNDFLAMGTENGVLISRDKGLHWEGLPTSGMNDAHVLDLAYSAQSKNFFAATEKNVYVYEPAEKHWKQLQDGFPAVQIERLEIFPGNPEMLYAVTDRGVYRLALGPEVGSTTIVQEMDFNQWELFRELIRREPSVGTIQKQTVRYADVGNGKIKKWHWGSRLRALVPTFSIGKDYSSAANIDIDRGGTADPDRYITGPRTKNQSWDMDLNWDLADLIWNTSETSIDSREKLMVELRDDLLNEVTRFYFERRRAQAEFVLQKPADEMERVHAILRLDELTANIDALTDGFLGRELDKLYARYPEFRTLWEK